MMQNNDPEGQNFLSISCIHFDFKFSILKLRSLPHMMTFAMYNIDFSPKTVM